MDGLTSWVYAVLLYGHITFNILSITDNSKHEFSDNLALQVVLSWIDFRQFHQQNFDPAMNNRRIPPNFPGTALLMISEIDDGLLQRPEAAKL